MINTLYSQFRQIMGDNVTDVFHGRGKPQNFIQPMFVAFMIAVTVIFIALIFITDVATDFRKITLNSPIPGIDFFILFNELLDD